MFPVTQERVGISDELPPTFPGTKTILGRLFVPRRLGIGDEYIARP